jgi:hypothetical protein
VKKQLIDQSQISPLIPGEFQDFKEFVGFIVQQRVQLYASDPRIGRLIQWQMLEEEGEKLIGSMAMTPDSWVRVVKKFQEEGMVSQNFPAHHIALFLYSAINGLILGTHKLFSLNEAENHAYIQMIVDCMGQFFKGE